MNYKKVFIKFMYQSKIVSGYIDVDNDNKLIKECISNYIKSGYFIPNSNIKNNKLFKNKNNIDFFIVPNEIKGREFYYPKSFYGIQPNEEKYIKNENEIPRGYTKECDFTKLLWENTDWSYLKNKYSHIYENYYKTFFKGNKGIEYYIENDNYYLCDNTNSFLYFLLTKEEMNINQKEVLIIPYIISAEKVLLDLKVENKIKQLDKRYSNGIKQIMSFLNYRNIIFTTEKRFKECKNKKTLPFDIYIENLNLCIEYDGRQHFESIEHWGGIKSLQKTKENDKIKNKYCKKRGINLIRIKYNEDIIKVLTKYIN